MLIQKVCSENQVPSFAWKHSGWVFTEDNYAFTLRPWAGRWLFNTTVVLSNQAKLDAGEECLSAALPCDVAGLVKQFFRELPEPVLPTELQDAFLKAQQLSTEDERVSATMLLSCVLPDRSICVLRHFFDFVHNVSLRFLLFIWISFISTFSLSSSDYLHSA